LDYQDDEYIPQIFDEDVEMAENAAHEAAAAAHAAAASSSGDASMPPPAGNTAPRVFMPGRDKLAADEVLDYDSSAYTMYHKMHVEWPCLTFDVVRDAHGANRSSRLKWLCVLCFVCVGRLLCVCVCVCVCSSLLSLFCRLYCESSKRIFSRGGAFNHRLALRGCVYQLADVDQQQQQLSTPL
jgi:hypothetical protein